MFRDFSPEFALAQAIVLFLGVGLHEYAHCKFADMAGDPTPSYYGRVTLNLTKHFEISGVIMMVLSSLVGFGIGWGKPAPITPAKMRHPRVDTFIAVAAGPLSNILQAVIYAFVLRLLIRGGAVPDDPYIGHPDFIVRLCMLGVLSNLGMALFNLIPFGPLDGHWLVGELLPDKQRYYWYRFNRQIIGFRGPIITVVILQSLHISLIWGSHLHVVPNPDRGCRSFDVYLKRSSVACAARALGCTSATTKARCGTG